MSYHVRPYPGYGVDTRFRVRLYLGHGVEIRIRIRPYLGYGIDVRSHVRPCLGHGVGMLLCMVISSILSIPSGSIGSPRICQRNDDYSQASLSIKGRRRLVHTINWIFWV
ncbi:Seizure 6 [Gossypium arboreum]|uniref:Seizure 6 n=1 Tax=Gossypium arboreum TaxID=29729 RepID=A0A0B0NNI6_GOSAR|nr:Seizure 6 [Gossypium arboreum]